MLFVNLSLFGIYCLLINSYESSRKHLAYGEESLEKVETLQKSLQA